MLRNFFNNKGYIAKFFLIFLIVGLITWGIYIFIENIINPPLYIIVQFDDLGPLYKKMPVYYKGYKIGITEKIEPSEDYQTTLVTVKFFPHELKLPENTTASVKPLNADRDYIELIYPQNPSSNILKTGGTIKGKTAVDIQSFMNAQFESGAIGNVIEAAGLAMNSITQTSNELKKLLIILSNTITENRKPLLKATNNLSDTTVNIREMSEKLNNSVEQEKAIQSTENIGKIISNTEKITAKLNKSMDRIDITLYEIQNAANNINEITDEINYSVSNRKGIMGFALGSKRGQSTKCANSK